MFYFKLEMERREAELRAKREEEERKHLEEALRARKEEEQKRLEEEELARRKQVRRAENILDINAVFELSWRVAGNISLSFRTLYIKAHVNFIFSHIQSLYMMTERLGGVHVVCVYVCSIGGGSPETARAGGGGTAAGGGG